MLRREMQKTDAQGRPRVDRAEDVGGRKYITAFNLLTHWIDDSLEVYKTELNRLKWPIFVYSFLNLVADNYPELSESFFSSYKTLFQRDHANDLRALELMRHPEHLEDSETARIYRNNTYRLTLVETTHFSLLQFLETKEREGGSVILSILQTHLRIVTVDRATTADRSFAAVLARKGLSDPLPEEDEGIPGHNPGSANTDRNAPTNVLTRLNLGPLPMETEAAGDVRDELEEADALAPPTDGQPSLIEELDRRIKRESSADAPDRESLPLPKPLARDVAADVQRIKDHRDRFQLPARGSGAVGTGPGVSVTMFTFHNTFDSVNCVGISGDNELIAAGTAESYARVWTMTGEPMPSTDPNATMKPASRRLIGHSGPIYDLSFCPNPSTLPSSVINGGSGVTYNNPGAHHLLLTCSGDGKIRLWSLATYSTLCIYAAHTHPVWAVEWSPQGHYFASASSDRTARLWSTEHVAPLRIFAGHDSDVETLAWHPNGCYLVTAGADRTVRMWDVVKGSSVRLFTGHHGVVTSLGVSPLGKVVASADDRGMIILWDLETGRRTKTLKGHGRGGIWSLSWSVEGTVLASGGADCTVRVWDAVSPWSAADGTGLTSGGQSGSIKTESKETKKSTVGPVGVGGAGGGLSKKDDAKISPEQISAFLTKKSPVYHVQFTNMNLVLAAGCYLPSAS